MKYLMTLLLLVSPCFAADTFLSGLKKDQRIVLKELAHGYQITVYTNEQLNKASVYKITAVGDDYIVVEDSLGFNEVRIPIYSIKSVITVKVPNVGK